MNAGMFVMLLGATAALFLAVRGLQSHQLDTRRKLWMGAAWVAIIAALAFFLQSYAA